MYQAMNQFGHEAPSQPVMEPYPVVQRALAVAQALTPVQTQAFMLLVGPVCTTSATVGISCDHVEVGPCAPLVAMGVFVQRGSSYVLTPLGYWVYAMCAVQHAAYKAPVTMR